MKFAILLHSKITAAQEKALDCLKKKEGQNTVEYLLMLGVIVGVALLVGKLLKDKFPGIIDKVFGKIGGGIDSME